MAVKAELERSCIIGAVLKTFICSLVKSKNLCFTSVQEIWIPDKRSMLGCPPSVSLGEQNVAGTVFTLHRIKPREHLPKSLIQFLF